jgi:type I restriction enzyme S subunit
MIPEGWKEVKLLESIDKIIDYRGQSVPKAESGIPLITARNVRKGYLSFKDQEFVDEDEYVAWMKRGFPKEGDVLFTTEAPLGYSAMFPTDQKYAVGQRTVTLRPKKLVLDGKYLMYFLLGPGHQRVKARATGSTALGIKSSELKKLKIYYPPYKEQKKIADILSIWDEGIGKLEKLIETKKLRRKGLMQQLLSGKLRLGKSKDDWKETKLGDIIEEYKEKSTEEDQYIVMTSSRNGLISQKEHFGDNRITKRSNIGSNILPLNYITYRSRSDDGSFQFNINSTFEYVLVSKYYPVFKSKEGNTNFLLAMLNHFSSKIGKYAVGTSQVVLGINALKEVKLKIPSLEEQKIISDVLDLFNVDIILLEKKLDAIKLQRKGLMQQLLTGKKRVKID